jgi:predicted phage-related endonuclease
VKVSTEVITEVVRSSVAIEKDKVVLDGTNADELIKEFVNAKEAIKAFEEKKANAESAIRALLGDKKFGIIDGVERVKVAERSRVSVDTELLQTAWAEAYEACKRTTNYDFLVVAK